MFLVSDCAAAAVFLFTGNCLRTVIHKVKYLQRPFGFSNKSTDSLLCSLQSKVSQTERVKHMTFKHMSTNLFSVFSSVHLFNAV